MIKSRVGRRHRRSRSRRISGSARAINHRRRRGAADDDRDTGKTVKNPTTTIKRPVKSRTKQTGHDDRHTSFDTENNIIIQ